MKKAWQTGCMAWIIALLTAAGVVAQEAAEERREAEAAESGSLFSSLEPAQITAGFRAWEHGNVEQIGDLLLPIYSLRSGILFLNPRGSVRDDEQEMNLGLGYRHLLADRKMIVGVNAYYDRRETKANKRYNQAGVGVEFLSEWVDARANYYRPDDDKKKVVTTVEGEPFTYTDRTTAWNTPYGSGHAVYQTGLRIDSEMRATPYMQFLQHEQAMEGFDAEIGVRLPIPLVQDWSDVKVFAGYYSYDNDISRTVDGWKGRLEIRALPALLLDAELYEDDDLNGSSYYMGARFQAPFDLAAWAAKKNPFSGTLAGFKPTRRAERSFEARLTEMVMRDPRIQTRLSQPFGTTTYSATEKLGETRKRLRQTLSDSILFVDGDNASGVEDGTYENPFRKIGSALAQLGEGMDTVFVWDAANPYRERLFIDTDGVSLIGSGEGLMGNGGRRFGSGVFPVLKGPSLNSFLKGTEPIPEPYATLNVMADDVLVAGLEFRGNLVDEVWALIADEFLDGFKDDPMPSLLEVVAQLSGIIAWDANNLMVVGNRFHGKAAGVVNLAAPIGIPANASFKREGYPVDPHKEHNLIVVDNVFEENAIGVLSGGLGYGLSGLNEDDANGFLLKQDVDPDTLPRIPANVVLANNRFQDNLVGAGVLQVGGGLNFYMIGNQFRNSGKMPVGVAALAANLDDTMNAVIVDNVIEGNHTIGMGLLQEGGNLNAFFIGNQFRDCQLTALAIEANVGTIMTATEFFEDLEIGNVQLLFSDNLFESNGRDIPIPVELLESKTESPVLELPDLPAVMLLLMGDQIKVEVDNCEFNRNRGGALLGLAGATDNLQFLVSGVTGDGNGTIFGDSAWIDDIPEDWNLDDEFPGMGNPFDYSFLLAGGVLRNLENGSSPSSALVVDSAFTDSGLIGAFVGDVMPLFEDILNAIF